MYLFILLIIFAALITSKPFKLHARKSGALFTGRPARSKNINPRLMGCSDSQWDAVREAWVGASQFAEKHLDWREKGLYQDVMTKYLGEQTATDSEVGQQNLQFYGPLRMNLFRAYGVFANRRTWSPQLEVAYIYCNEENALSQKKLNNGPDTQCSSNGLQMYSWNQRRSGDVPMTKHMVLCPSFFNDYFTVQEVSALGDAHPLWSQNIDIWLSTRARVILHEVYHWSPEVAVPACDLTPEVRNPEEVIELAQRANTYGAYPFAKGARSNRRVCP